MIERERVELRERDRKLEERMREKKKRSSDLQVFIQGILTYAQRIYAQI
jgi:hypothetical protein